MNRTDRLLAIVLELQGAGARRAEDLAATFEVSKRTIYRDVQALCEAGVPVIATPGRGYELLEGYFLPPLRFTSGEATMLLLGVAAVARHFDSEYREAAETAGRKIAGVLAPELRAVVGDLRGSLHILAPETEGQLAERLRLLRRAIGQRRSARFQYFARESDLGTSQSRTVDPYALVHVTGTWYLSAFDHHRRAQRNFRLERMDGLQLLPNTFTRPPGFRLMPPEDPSRNTVLRVLFDRDIARWVREQRSFFTVDETDTPDGLLVTLAVRHERDALQWLLSWGRHVRVLEPASLRELLRDEARSMIRNAEEL